VKEQGQSCFSYCQYPSSHLIQVWIFSFTQYSLWS